jgi:hypothetical protein
MMMTDLRVISAALLMLWLQAEAAAPPLLVLTATGEQREGLTVAVPDPDGERYLRALTRGYAARLLRLYPLAQRFAHPGRAPQPGLLVLSDNEGGFPRRGLYLEGPRPDIRWVDLHRRSQPDGRFGAVDQIFPHELLHIMVSDLAGPCI